MENIDQNLVIGVDVGGQTSKCGIVDTRGTVIAQTVIRTDNHDTVEPFIAELSSALKKLIEEAGAEGKIRGIGVGAPNANYYTGDIENAVNVMYQVDVYSNLNTGKKAQTKAIIALLDEVLAGYRFVRTFCNPVQNFNDATIYRMTARYTRRITNQDEIYKED